MTSGGPLQSEMCRANQAATRISKFSEGNVTLPSCMFSILVMEVVAVCVYIHDLVVLEWFSRTIFVHRSNFE